MSDDEYSDEEQYLSEFKQRLLDYDVVTPAFIRQDVYPKLKSVSGDIVHLCTKYVKPVVFENEADDPVNFISDDDKAECEKYKVEGNQYFEEKAYSEAMMKYTTALRMYLYRNQPITV